MQKLCFTINPNRKTEEFISYHRLFAENKFQAIEIFYPYNKSEKEINIYTENVLALKKFNPEIVLHLPYGLKNDLCDEKNYPEALAVIKAGIDYGKIFSAKKYTLHLGYQKLKEEERDRNILLEKCIETLKNLCQYAYPGYIMIENMPSDNEMGYSPEEIYYLIKKTCEPNLKFIYDIGHAHVSEFDDFSYLEVLKQELFHIHISDNNGSHDSHMPIASGNIDFKEFVEKIKDYKELICLEILFDTDNDLLKYYNDIKKFY